MMLDKKFSETGHIRLCFYGDFVYEFKITLGKPTVSDRFKTKRYKRVSWKLYDYQYISWHSILFYFSLDRHGRAAGI